MHKHRLCLGRHARPDTEYQEALPKRAQGWRGDALPTVWNKRWRANHTYHQKKRGRGHA